MNGLVARVTSAPRRLLGRRFAREVMTLQMGSMATMGIQFITSVVIANLLGPGPLGTYYQARALLDLVTMISNLAVGQALITKLAASYTTRDRAENLQIIGYFLKMGLTVALIESAVGVIWGSSLGAIFLDDPEIGQLARVLFICPPLMVVFNMVVLALQSSRQVKRLTLLENGALMATSLANVGVVLLGGNVQELLYSVALIPLFTAATGLWLYRSTLSRMPSFPTLGEILRIAPSVPYRRYFSFAALVSVDKNIANVISLAPTILLGRWASSEEVAYYRVATNMTMTLLSVPMSPISRNLYAKLAEVKTKAPERMAKTLVQVTAGGLGISAVMTVGLMIAAPFILQIYKPAFQPALVAMYALTIRCATLGFAIGLGPLYQVMDRMGLAILSKIPPAIVMVGGGYLLINSMGAAGAAWTVSLTYLVGDIISAVIIWRLLRRKDPVTASPPGKSRQSPLPRGEG